MKRVYFGLGLLIMVSSGHCAVDKNHLTHLQDLQIDNPEQALLETTKLWQDENHSIDFELGLIHVRALISAQNFSQARLIVEDFKSRKSISDDQLDLLLGVELHLARQSEDPADFDHAIEKIHNKLREINSESNSSAERKKLTLHSDLAVNYYYKQNFEQAEIYYLKTINNFESFSPKVKSNVLNRLGVVYALQARSIEASEYMLKAVDMLEENNLPVNSTTFQNLGALYFQLKDFQKTIKYSELALKVKTNTDAKTVALYSNIAAAYVELGQQELAIQKLNKSIQVSEELNVSAANARNNLGYIYHQMGRYEEALEQLNIGAQDIDLEANNDIKGVSYKSRADVYASMKNYDKAIELYEQAHQAFNQNDYKHKRAELYPKMIKVHELQGNYQRAYQLMVEFKTLNDELTDTESSKQLNEILTNFEVEQNKKALEDSEIARAQQQKNLDLLNSKNKAEKRITTSMIIMVSALVLLLLYIFRSWHYRGRVNKALTDKNDYIVDQQNQLLKLNNQLKGQAEIDELTNIHNRRFINGWLTTLFAAPHKTTKRWCLVIIDIDDFKAINDNYGHQRGDEVLQLFSVCLGRVISEVDLIARWGGEEFLWLIEVPDNQDVIELGSKKCELFKTTLSNSTWFRNQEETVSCSMGFVSFPLINLSSQDWETALKVADSALYEAKSRGKDQWLGIEIVNQNLVLTDFNDVNTLLNSGQLRFTNK